MCIVFVLNGQQVNIGQDINLLEYLRDYARLTSVKNGCDEGAGNVCRCTGYVKIEQAVLMAAKALREGFTPPASLDYKVGDEMPRVDAKAKTLGTAQYVDDMYLEGMLHAATSVHPCLY